MSFHIFRGLCDTVPSSEPLAEAILRFLAVSGGTQPFWKIFNQAIGDHGLDDDLVWRRNNYRIALLLTALESRGLICPVADDSEYHRVRYRLTALGQRMSPTNTTRAMDKLMKDLDVARGYSAQTVFLKGLDVIVPTEPNPPTDSADSRSDGSRAARRRRQPRDRKPPTQSPQSPRPTLRDVLGEHFDPSLIDDERERVVATIVRRRGQDKFRATLIETYGGRCVITGDDVVDALEAAHIIPYKGAKSHHPGNGLLLRADLHTLFDLGLLTIDTKTMTVMIAPELRATRYSALQGRALQLPDDAQICVEALDYHRRGAEQRWEASTVH